MTDINSPRTSSGLYTRYFKLARPKTSPPASLGDLLGTNRLKVVLEYLQAHMEQIGPGSSARQQLEEELERIIRSSVASTNDAQDIMDLLLEAIRGLDPEVD